MGEVEQQHQDEPSEDAIVLNEIFMAGDGAPEKGDGLLWKDILREGEIALTPGLTGVLDRPLKIVSEGPSSPDQGVVSMSDVEDSFQNRAFEHVTVPLSHKNSLTENTGFVRKLRRKVRDGVNYLQAGMEFTEPEIGGKAERGTIANCSSGIYFDFVRKADKRRFKAALNHVALTNTPWIPNMAPFGALASDDEVDEATEVRAFHFTSDEDEAGEIVWKEEESTQWLVKKVQGSLKDFEKKARTLGSEVYYFVQDVALGNKALVSEEASGNSWVVPFQVEDGEVTVADPSRWTETRAVMVAASDDETGRVTEPTGNVVTSDHVESGVVASEHVRQDQARNSGPAKDSDTGGRTVSGINLADLPEEHRDAVANALAEKDQTITNLSDQKSEVVKEKRKGEVETKITKLTGLGLGDQPGLLKYVRRAYLGDALAEGDAPKGILAADDDNPETQEVSLSDFIDGFIERLPKNTEGKLNLSDQANEIEAGDLPPRTDEKDEEDVETNVSDFRTAIKPRSQR